MKRKFDKLLFSDDVTKQASLLHDKDYSSIRLNMRCKYLQFVKCMHHAVRIKKEKLAFDRLF